MTVRSSSISVLLAAWKDSGAVLDSNIFANLANVSCMYWIKFFSQVVRNGIPRLDVCESC